MERAEKGIAREPTIMKQNYLSYNAIAIGLNSCSEHTLALVMMMMAGVPGGMFATWAITRNRL